MSYTTMTGIFRPSKRSLVEYINAANNSDLTVEELIFGIPAPIEGTWREDNTNRNTIIRITAREISDYRESTLILYDRLKLNNLNKLLEFKVGAYLPTTTHDLLLPIWRRYGILISPEDIIEESLIDQRNPGEYTQSLEGVLRIRDLRGFRDEDSGQVPTGPDPEPVDISGDEIWPVYILRAKPDSIGWTGQCSIEVSDGDAILGDYMTQHHLPGLNYPVDDNGENGSALVYMYGLDFTDVKDVLETYPEELVVDEFSTDLLDAIKQIDVHDGRELWNLDPEATEWSLHGAEIVYSGINDISLPTNSKYKYVLGIKLRDDISTPPGVMYLHYNDPFDPDEI